MRVVFMLMLGACVALHAQEPDYGAVHGTVLNYASHALGGGQITLTSREEEFTTPIGNDGKFQIHARPGIYSVRVDREGIIPYQRAQIVIRAGRITTLNVRPVFAEPDPGVHYFSFGVPGVIGLGAVMRRVDHARAEPNTLDQDYMMFSFDSLVVYAPSINCDRRIFRCVAEGGAVIEISDDSGVRVEHSAKIEINLTQRNLTLMQGETASELSF